MNALDWLQQKAAGFSELSVDELSAITEFTLLWSFFEAQALDRNGNANSIVEAAKRWDAVGLLKNDFAETADYFCARYYRDSEFTCHFDQLHLRRREKPALVKKFLKGECEQEWEAAAAVLIIIYRFRNNLFHGEKWAYNLQDQRTNFEQANNALMAATEIDRREREESNDG